MNCSTWELLYGVAVQVTTVMSLLHPMSMVRIPPSAEKLPMHCGSQWTFILTISTLLGVIHNHTGCLRTTYEPSGTGSIPVHLPPQVMPLVEYGTTILTYWLIVRITKLPLYHIQCEFPTFLSLLVHLHTRVCYITTVHVHSTRRPVGGTIGVLST